MSSGKTAVTLLPPTPPPLAELDEEEEDEEGPSETDDRDPPSTARSTTEETRRALLRVKAELTAETIGVAMEVATPPRVATTIDGSGVDVADVSSSETPAARAPLALPRATGRMVASSRVWRLSGTKKRSARAGNVGRGGRERKSKF